MIGTGTRSLSRASFVTGGPSGPPFFIHRWGHGKTTGVSTSETNTGRTARSGRGLVVQGVGRSLHAGWYTRPDRMCGWLVLCPRGEAGSQVIEAESDPAGNHSGHCDERWRGCYHRSLRRGGGECRH
ncbi:hypothetical protein [Caudoviricetes sp.]|nr:hypothetical protein [Caudoviricetes sp.]